MNRRLMRTAVIFSLIFVCRTASVAAPGLMHFQGRLLDAERNPRSGTFAMTFSIWDAPSGGALLWSETQAAVPVNNGMFSVRLGSVSPLTPDLFASDGRWLQIQVGAETLSPRERLLSSAYAFRASTADAVADGSVQDRHVHANAGIAWTKISKTGSALNDIDDVDAGGAAPGMLLVRGTTAWILLAPGVNGQMLAISTGTPTPVWQTPLAADISFLDGRANLAWNNQPAALTEFSATTRYRLTYDLTTARQVRLVAQVMTAGAANAQLRVQYSVDGGTTWNYLDGSTGPSVSINVTGTRVSPWVPIVAAARTDCLLRLVGINGDGVADPAFGRISAQFR